MKTVYIEVSGGVAEVTQGVPGIDVEIIDWDNIQESTPEKNRADWPEETQAFIRARYPDQYAKYFGKAI